MTETVFMMDDALAAMASQQDDTRYRRHRSGKKVFAADLGTSEADHVKLDGVGRGALARLTAEGIIQGAIALRLIDCGCDVAEAYRVGAAFAYSGQIEGPAAVTHGNEKPAEPDPVRDRWPGKLFLSGDTILIYQPADGQAPILDRYRIISTQDPNFPKIGADAVSVGLSTLVANGKSHAPIVILNLTDLCRLVCNRLGVSRTEVFGGEA